MTLKFAMTFTGRNRQTPEASVVVDTEVTAE